MTALAVISIACEKEIPQEPQEQTIPAKSNVVVFTANVPTKTTIDANDQVVSWTAGDVVKFVWEGGSTTATASSSGSSTTFSVEVGEGIDELYAVYPADAGGSYDSGNVNVHFNGSRTDGSFAANDICVAKAVKNGDTWSTTLAFKNVACLLKVGVTDSEVTKIQVMGGKETGTAQAISGLLPVNINGSGVLTTGTATDTGVTVSMTVSGTGNYYIPVLPGVTLSDGFRVGLFKGEDQGTPFFYNGSYTTASGIIIKMSDIESHAGQYYVTPSGAGTKAGQSWTNAMDAATFKDFIENNDNYFILRGATFHFSADVFSFGDDYLKPDFSGHGEVAFTIEGTKSGANITTFQGRANSASGSDSKAGVLWPKTSTNITVKNVKFTGTDGGSNATAIRLNSTGVKLQLEDCVFEGNKTSGQGAALGLYKGTVSIEGCEFTGNQAGSAPSIYIEAVTVTVKECTFTNNTGDGTAFKISNTSAVVDIQDCEITGGNKCSIWGVNANTVMCTRVNFHDNHAVDDGGAGAYLEGSGTYTFIDCDFVNNAADTRGGAISINSSDVHASFSGGKFQGNHTDSEGNNNAGGAIYASGSGGVIVDCANVLFKENYSFTGANTSAGGIIKVNHSGDNIRFNNCVFDGNYSNRSASSNNACAAIVNCRTGGANFYFNACEFKENTSGTGNSGNVQGGLRGTVFATMAGSTFAFNNCSFHDNYGGRNSDEISWIGMDHASSTLILANTTIVGDNYRAPGVGGARKNNWGVVKFHNMGSFYLLNTILCSLDPVGNSFWVNGDIMVDGVTTISDGGPKLPVYCWYSKISKEGDDRTNWTVDTGSGHDYYATSASFGSWNAPYMWNGTLTGTNSNMLAATADVNTQIQNADADFYTWLSSIGALGKDINGNNRGATSWPGCYQSN